MLFLYQIYNAILASQAGRTMTFPFSSKRLISKALDTSQTPGSRNCNDIFPLLVSLQNIDRYFRDASYDATMLKYLPHTENSIYTVIGMSSA